MRYFFFLLALLPLVAAGQKSLPPLALVPGTTTVRMYEALTDTTYGRWRKLYRDERVYVQGQVAPGWVRIDRDDFKYYIRLRELVVPAGVVLPQLQLPGQRPAPMSTASAGDAATARTEEYCTLVASARFLSLKFNIFLDFGQERRLFDDNRYRNEAGKVQTFNSVVDALNFMNGQGWEFVNAFVVSVGRQNVYYYMMKRRMGADAPTTR